MVRFDPESDRLEALPHTYPHEPCQSRWHGVLYDAVADPADGAVYMAPWKARPHLARFHPEEGRAGRLEDLGMVTRSSAQDLPIGVNLNHVGGLVFGDDGCLYYVKATWAGGPCAAVQRRSREDTIGVLCRLNPVSGEHEELCTLQGGAGMDHYVARGAKDPGGNFYFGKILARPAGFYRVEVGKVPTVRPNTEWLRYWG
jgi:hypothetical protein